jgi:hypothetical protein
MIKAMLGTNIGKAHVGADILQFSLFQLLPPSASL